MPVTDWATIFPGFEPDPIRGVVSDHEHAAELARRAADATSEAQRIFREIRVGELTELKGAFAEAFVNLVGELDQQLADLTPVFDSLTGIFDRHADDLAALRQEASAALARATTRWNESHEAEAGHTAAAGVLASIDRQLGRLRSQPDSPELADQIEATERQRWRQAGEVQWWSGQVSQAADDLEASRNEYRGLVDDESALIEHTCRAIRAVPLGSLKDPSGLLNSLRELAGAAWGFVTDVAEAAADLVGAVIDTVVEALTALVEVLAAVAAVVIDALLAALAVAIGVVLIVVAAVVIVAVLALVVWVGVQIVSLISLLPAPIQYLIYSKVEEVIRSLWEYDGDPARRGDLGGTFDLQQIDPQPEFGGAEGGRAAILEALGLLDDTAPDEFILVQLDDGKWVVVLPGVTDLSDPDFGLNPYDRTVRDMDQYALPSSTSASIDDNLYAQMVRDALARNGVPPGADIMIVGHSFGADTALDLAADPGFTSTYNVSHVVAAAYHSGPQLDHVRPGTEVLVLQNTNDAAVQVEHLGYDGVAGVYGYGDAVGSFLSGDLGGGFRDLGGSLSHFGGVGLDVLQLRHGINPLASTMTPHVAHPNPGQTVAVFDGGTAGVGHDPANYTDYLLGHTEPSIAQFEASVAAAGYSTSGTVYTVDVSVPVGEG